MSKPDYDLFLVSRDKKPNGTRVYTNIGAGWIIFNGTAVNIKLKPGTVLDWRITEEYYLTLKPQSEPPPYDCPFPSEDNPIPF